MAEGDIDQQDAPVLGEPTDIDAVVTNGEAVPDGVADTEQTIGTPDQLGGTGGGQAGGAG